MKLFNKRNIVFILLFVLGLTFIFGFIFCRGSIYKKLELKKALSALDMLQRAMLAEQRYFKKNQTYTENPLNLDIALPGITFEGKEEDGFYWGERFGFKFYFEPFGNNLKAIRAGCKNQQYTIGFNLEEKAFYCDSISDICTSLFGERKDIDPIGSEFLDHSSHDHGHGHYQQHGPFDKNSHKHGNNHNYEHQH